MCNTVIFICSQFYKVLGQKFSLYREGSSLFKFNFVPSFSEGQNIIQYNYSINQKTETTVRTRKLKLQYKS